MTAETHRETEAKFDVAPDFVLPNLAPLLRRTDSVQVSTVSMSSTYYDSETLGLSKSRVTLRQRTGDDDTGWHLKVPGGGFRTELRWPLAGNDGIPDELRTLIAPLLDETADIAATVRLRTVRTRHRIIDRHGALRVEIADDEVHADSLGRPVRVSRWREVEAELGPAGRLKDLAAVARLLAAHGVAPSATSSKVGRALFGVPIRVEQGPSAGDVVGDYLRAQLDAIVAGHFAVSLNPPAPIVDAAPDESVHHYRVAIRRLRSTLRTFKGLFDADAARELEAELAWIGTELGPVRDCQVLIGRLRSAVDELPGYLVVGPVAEQLTNLLGGQLETHARSLRYAMGTDRYRALLHTLAQWRVDPPHTHRAAAPAKVLTAEFAKAQQRLAVHATRMTQDRAVADELHRARKGAKRARYAGEALEPLLGKPAAQLVKTATVLQNALGEYQDSVVTTDTLRRLADEAAAIGDSTFTYGVLVGEQRRAAADAASYARTLRV